MGSFAAAAFLLRRLRADLGQTVLLVVLVALTSFLFAGAPRLFNLAADAGLVREVGDAPAPRRGLELSATSRVSSSEESASTIEARGGAHLRRFPASVLALVAESRVVATTPRFALDDPPDVPTFVALRYQDGLGTAIRFVAGREPASTGEELPPAGSAPDPTRRPARIEIALSDETARATGLEVGDIVDVALDGGDPLVGRPPAEPLQARFDVVGVFAVAEPRGEIWYGDPRLVRPAVGGTIEAPIVLATALIARDALADVLGAGLPVRQEWRYLVDASRMDAGLLDGLEPDLRRLATKYPTSPLGVRDPATPVLRTGLLELIDRYRAERAAAEVVLAVAAVGPVALALGSIAMAAVLLAGRRQSGLALARERGASSPLILGAQAMESTMLAGGASLLGLVAALALVPGRWSDLSIWVALATGVMTVLLLIGATWWAIRHPVNPSGRDAITVRRPSPRRLVFELTAIVLAVIGLALLQRRGLTIDEAGAGFARFDPFLAAVPVLVAFAVALVAIRLYPVPVRALGALVARRRDLVPVLGLRSIGRRPALAALPLLVLMLAAGFGAFVSVVLSSVEAGQVESSWAAVGADYRVEAAEGEDLSTLDLAAVAGMNAVADGFVDEAAAFESATGIRGQIELVALDPARYAAVTADAPIQAAWPARFLAGAAPTDPVPVIVSSTVPPGHGRFELDELFPMVVAGRSIMLQVADVRAAFPGVAPGRPFVVAPIDALERVTERDLAPNVAFVRGPASALPALAAAVSAASPSATVTTRAAAYAGLHDAPLVALVADGFRLALVVAAGYAACSVVAALALSAGPRTRDLAFLRTLGLSTRQAAGITTVEHAIPFVAALVPGLAIGIAVAALLQSSLGLEAFIGAEASFRIQIDWPAIGLIGGALLLVVAITVVGSTWQSGRARSIAALRAGEA